MDTGVVTDNFLLKTSPPYWGHASFPSGNAREPTSRRRGPVRTNRKTCPQQVVSCLCALRGLNYHGYFYSNLRISPRTKEILKGFIIPPEYAISYPSPLPETADIMLFDNLRKDSRC